MYEIGGSSSQDFWLPGLQRFSSQPDPELEGLLALGTDAGDIAIFNLASRTLAQASLNNVGEQRKVRRVKFAADGETLYAANDRHLTELSAENFVMKNNFIDTGFVLDFSFNLEARTLYTCSSRTIKLWDTRYSEARPNHTIHAPRPSMLTCMDFLPSQNLLVTGDSGGQVSSWNLRTLTQETQRRDSAYSIKTIAIGPNNLISTGSREYIYNYQYMNAQYVQLNYIKGEPWWGKSVVECKFPSFDDTSLRTPAVFAFTESIRGYNGVSRMELTLAKQISNHVNDAEILSFAATHDAATFFTGHMNGRVAAYTPKRDIVRTLPLSLGRGITTLDYHM